MGKNTKTEEVVVDAPRLSVRKAPHGAIWSVWANIHGEPAEEIFECSSEKEALKWIPTGGRGWIEDRRRRRVV
jgi:hypothetical protein